MNNSFSFAFFLSIASIPEELFRLKRLETISLTHNRLTTIPNSVSKLGALKTLSLAANRITTFPMGLCELKHLDSVDLSQNSLTSVPDGVGRLQAVELNLNQNQVRWRANCVIVRLTGWLTGSNFCICEMVNYTN